MAIRIFGFDLFSSADDDEGKKNLKSVAAEPNDGSAVVEVGGVTDNGVIGDAFGLSMTLDIDPTAVSEQQLITKYRETALIDVVENAIDDIVNEMVTGDENQVVSIDLDEVPYTDELKDKIREEFDHILHLLDFNNEAYDILKRWYIDGRIQYQVVVDQTKYKNEGISKLTYLDPRLVKKVRVVRREKDIRTGADLFSDVDTYWLYSDAGFGSGFGSAPVSQTRMDQGVKLSEESIVQAPSGLLNPSNTMVLSYLHLALRPLNQLRGLEDAAIIYRLSRAPERRVFYIDVGNLPPAKAEQVLQRQAQRYRSKQVYDVSSGSTRADPKQMIMTEDYFLPRRTDGKATEISTLPGGQNLGEMAEVEYFLNKVFRSLKVPISRMDSQSGFNFGRVTEINRDELKFMKFVSRLRKKFSVLFIELLRRQLALKNIVNPNEFDNIKSLISFEFKSDNMFEEAKYNEIMNGRMELLSRINEYKGVYYSVDFIRRNVLHQSEEEIKEIDKQIKKEEKSGIYQKDQSGGGNFGDDGMATLPFNPSGGNSSPAIAPDPGPAPAVSQLNS